MQIDTSIDLDDKFARPSGRIFATGMQALVRLALEQRRRDRAAGHRTAGFISGYRGSPISGFDRELWRAQKHLDADDIHFRPAVNEEIAATSLWGSQQVGMFRDPKVEGVFGMWYGKAPGLDRAGDALRHANQAGTSPLGGVLVIVGDDHSAKSSAFGAQSEYAFMDWMMPVMAPANVGEFIDLGLFGFALSRFSGLWTGYKVAGVSADSSATIELPELRDPFVRPDVALPRGGLHIRSPEPDRAEYEARVKQYRLPAAIAFARANGANRRLFDSARPRVGIVVQGKATGDLMQAFADLGLDAETAEALGLRVLKLGMTFPLDPVEIVDFARGLETVIVVEEKRAFVEDQIKSILFDARLAAPPRVLGKRDEEGAPLLSDSADFASVPVARALVPRIATDGSRERFETRLARMEQASRPSEGAPLLARTPYFCSGCPHNRSTVLPDDSTAIGGIGCHTLATRMDRGIRTITHMGGEGASWIGIAPFVGEDHIFQNVGDGTYFHSAQLCVRAAVAADVNITFKILYNDAIAMTGGQPLDGTLTVPQLAQQVAAENVVRIALVSDDPGKYGSREGFPVGMTIHHRDELDSVQRQLRDVRGTTVLIYDQTCAAEKRRRRKRGRYPDPPVRVFINEEVCEGCGDCGRKSNCLSVTPVETELGTKRQIDQASCNKDYSCLDGFCPSFVRIEGGGLRRAPARPQDEALPPGGAQELDAPHSLLLAGIGGTGIVTVGAIVGMAAHLQGLACTVNDVTGSAQKGGLVASHIVLARSRDDIKGERIGLGRADAFVAADLVVGATPEILDRIGPETRFALVNTDPAQTGSFLADPSKRFPGADLRERIVERFGGRDTPRFLAASTAAMRLTGDVVGTNMLLLGHAWQSGAVPLALESIERAIRLNGVAVDANLAAFDWGRRLMADPAFAESIGRATGKRAESLDEIVEDRADRLTAYQSSAYADRYRILVDEVRAAEARVGTRDEAMATAVARNAYTLMAYKDEYEVARLLTSSDFTARIGERFEGDYKVAYMMAPPILARPDPATGHPRKRRFGPWIKPVLATIARLRPLRGTFLDPFARTEERRMERSLMREYEETVRRLAGRLDVRNHAAALRVAELPESVRGYGHIKAAAIDRYRKERSDALAAFDAADQAAPHETARAVTADA